MPKHIPRRSGVGIRQAIQPAEPKPKIRRRRLSAPETCGALHPDRPGIVDGETGEQLIDPLYCTGSVDYVPVDGGKLGFLGAETKRVIHRGDHRARPLKGVVVRWPATGDEAAR